MARGAAPRTVSFRAVPLVALDHVNIRTANVARLVAFYRDVLGIVPGPRPAFDFPGAWLYCAGRPVVHLVEAADGPHAAASATGLSHFAFSATDLPALLSRLDAAGVSYRMTPLPGAPIRQVHFSDPDGNELHADFADDAT